MPLVLDLDGRVLINLCVLLCMHELMDLFQNVLFNTLMLDQPLAKMNDQKIDSLFEYQLQRHRISQRREHYKDFEASTLNSETTVSVISMESIKPLLHALW